MKKVVMLLTAAFLVLGVVAIDAQGVAAATEYTGEAKGFKSQVKVKVTLDGDKITAVDVISQDDTPAIAKNAVDKVPGAIVAKQSADVDVAAGATMTSKGIINAVKDALAKKPAAAPAKPATPEKPAAAAKTELTGEAKGFKSQVKVKVTLEGEKITAVQVVSHDDTPAIAKNAVDKIPGAIVAKQSADVDVVAGATMTSTGIKNAVKNALASKPATKPTTPTAPAKPAAPKAVNVAYKLFGQNGKVDIAVINGDVYVGVRSAAKAAGGELTFDNATKQVVVTAKGFELRGQQGQKGVTINGKSFVLDAPVANVDGALYVQAHSAAKIAGELANRSLTVSLVKNVLELK